MAKFTSKTTCSLTAAHTNILTILMLTFFGFADADGRAELLQDHDTAEQHVHRVARREVHHKVHEQVPTGKTELGSLL
jgi:hypothetical protein